MKRGTFSLNLLSDEETPLSRELRHAALDQFRHGKRISEVSVRMAGEDSNPIPLKNLPREEGEDDVYLCLIKEFHFPKKVCVYERVRVRKSERESDISKKMDGWVIFNYHFFLKYSFKISFAISDPHCGNSVFCDKFDICPPHANVPMY